MKSENKLKIIFGGLVGVIAILILVIALIGVKPKEEEGEGYVEIGPDLVNCGDLDSLDDNSEVVNCLGILYEKKGEEETIAEYDRRIDAAFEKKDYELFYDLLLGKAAFSQYTLHKSCNDTISILDDKRISELGPSVQVYYYEEAAGIADECLDKTGVELFEKKIEQLQEEHGEELNQGGAYE